MELTEKQNSKETFKMERFQAELVTYGDKKGTYNVTVRFQNEQFESFQFKINDELSNKFIALILDEVSTQTGKLVSDLENKLLNTTKT